jgi:hypothetical protein
VERRDDYAPFTSSGTFEQGLTTPAHGASRSLCKGRVAMAPQGITAMAEVAALAVRAVRPSRFSIRLTLLHRSQSRSTAPKLSLGTQLLWSAMQAAMGLLRMAVLAALQQEVT